MQYTGTQQIVDAKRKYVKQLQQQLDIILNRNKGKAQGQTAAIFNSIQRDILNIFKKIANEKFPEVFYGYYGNNCNKEALMKSLSFGVNNNLQPYVKYKMKDFYTASDYQIDKKMFNQNNVQNGVFDHQVGFNALSNIEELDFTTHSIKKLPPYNQAVEDIHDLKYKKFFEKNKKNMIFNPKEIYEEAIAKSMEEFWNQYQKHIKHDLLIKHKLKL